MSIIDQLKNSKIGFLVFRRSFYFQLFILIYLSRTLGLPYFRVFVHDEIQIEGVSASIAISELFLCIEMGRKCVREREGKERMMRKDVCVNERDREREGKTVSFVCVCMCVCVCVGVCGCGCVCV